jgi:hypothetical protein
MRLAVLRALAGEGPFSGGEVDLRSLIPPTSLRRLAGQHEQANDSAMVVIVQAFQIATSSASSRTRSRGVSSAYPPALDLPEAPGASPPIGLVF